jgi:hypothetical protein
MCVTGADRRGSIARSRDRRFQWPRTRDRTPADPHTASPCEIATPVRVRTLGRASEAANRSRAHARALGTSDASAGGSFLHPEVTMKKLLALAPLALLAACSSDPAPVTYSAPVGISLPVASKDVVSGAVQVDKNITTESGNPYGAFVNAARARIGHDPSRIVVTGTTVELLATSNGVTALEQAFTRISISFVMSGTNAVYPVAQIANPTGAGPVPLQVGFDSAVLPEADRAALAQGQFKVVLSGTTAAGFDSANALADVVATLSFEAFE